MRHVDAGVMTSTTSRPTEEREPPGGIMPRPGDGAALGRDGHAARRTRTRVAGERLRPPRCCGPTAARRGRGWHRPGWSWGGSGPTRPRPSGSAGTLALVIWPREHGCRTRDAWESFRPSTRGRPSSQLMCNSGLADIWTPGPRRHHRRLTTMRRQTQQPPRPTSVGTAWVARGAVVCRAAGQVHAETASGEPGPRTTSGPGSTSPPTRRSQ